MSEEFRKKRSASTSTESPEDPSTLRDDDEWIGPLPSEALKSVKKRKILEFEKVYLDALPSSDAYERSFMHKDPIAFVRMTKSEFLITASTDGHLKFWKVSYSVLTMSSE